MSVSIWIFNFPEQLIVSLNAQKENLEELFRTAVARQTDIMVANILGYGLDIPLLGLREACKENNGGELCDLFTDDGYKMSQCFLLSTSQVQYDNDRLGIF